MNVVGQVIPVFLNNAQINIELVCVLFKNIRTSVVIKIDTDQ